MENDWKFRRHMEAHCRELIYECLNIVEKIGDTYVAIHRDEDTDCVILVTKLRYLPLLSIVLADELAFKENRNEELLLILHNVNASSVTGWRSFRLSDDSVFRLYRQCAWLSMALSYEDLFPLLKKSIQEYKGGKYRITMSGRPTDPAA